MVTKGRKVGDASPIRKAHIALQLCRATNPIVVYGFEKRIDASSCNKVAFEFGHYLSNLALSLPKGEFDLGDAFYETDMLTIKDEATGKLESYDSVGEYVGGINIGDSDTLESERWLRTIAELLAKHFLDENIPLPAEDELFRLFTEYSGEDYLKAQRGLAYAFRIAKDEDKLEEILFDVLRDLHAEYMKHFAAELVKRRDEDMASPMQRVYEMLPFEIVSETSVGAVYDSLLAVILAAGVEVNQMKLFELRIKRGREYLKWFTGPDRAAKMEEDPTNAIADAILTHPKELQPLLPGYLSDALYDNWNCLRLATVLKASIWNPELLEVRSNNLSPLGPDFD